MYHAQLQRFLTAGEKGHYAFAEKGQCRKTCSLSSIPVLHEQMGIIALELCRNLCSFSGLNLTRQSISRHLTPRVSVTAKVVFVPGLTFASILR